MCKQRFGCLVNARVEFGLIVPNCKKRGSAVAIAIAIVEKSGRGGCTMPNLATGVRVVCVGYDFDIPKSLITIWS